jgi:hypothetical protein
MHNILVLLYCCSVSEHYPVSKQWFRRIKFMCDILLPLNYPPLEYDEDPNITISFFHSHFEPSTMDLDVVIPKFMGPTSNISTSVWGPPAWDLLHGLARDEHKYTLVEPLLECWKHVLPCGVCREHLTSHLENTTLDHKTPEEAHKYTILLHNAVNSQLEKPMYIQ